MIPFQEIQEDERALIDLAFNKKKADDRKEWLRNFKVNLSMMSSSRCLELMMS
jgi:DNA topoisomerase-2